jgi:hypothetical protein
MPLPSRFTFLADPGLYRVGRTEKMVPSIATIALGLLITAALAVVDWYVWRMAPILPYPLEASPGQRVVDEEEEVTFSRVA